MIVEILLIACLILAIVPIRSKSVKALVTSIILGVMICIFAGNNSSVDQYAYSILYYDHTYFSVESGYLALTTLAFKIGLSYVQFKALIMFIAFCMLYTRIKEFKSISIRKVLLLWGFTSFWFDIEQSRYMIAACIIIFATKYLETWKFSNLVKYVLLVFLAFTIHTTMIVFLALILVYCKIGFLNILALISCVATAILVLMGGQIILLGQLIYTVIPNERILMWFSFHTRFGWLGPVAVQFFIFGTLWYWKRTLWRSNMFSNLSVNETSFLVTVYKIFLVSFLFMPMYILSTEFLRLIRGFFLLYFASVSIYYTFSKARNKLYIIFENVLFIVLFNLQGLRGILFYNDYFVEYMILKNDINTNSYWLLFLGVISIVIYFVITHRRKLRFVSCKIDSDKT